MNIKIWTKYLISEGNMYVLDPSKLTFAAFKKEFYRLLSNKYFLDSLFKKLYKLAMNSLQEIDETERKQIIEFIKNNIHYRAASPAPLDVFRNINTVLSGKNLLNYLKSEDFYRLLQSLYDDMRKVHPNAHKERLLQDKYILANFYYDYFKNIASGPLSFPALKRPESSKLLKSNLSTISQRFYTDERDVPEDSILSKIKIVRFIGAGAYGSIYELSDGRVIKIFEDSVDLQKDLERYDKVIEDLFDQSSSHDLSSKEMHYFEQGKIGKSKFMYAIMPKIIPIKAAPWFDYSSVFENVANASQNFARKYASSGKTFDSLSYNEFKNSILTKVSDYMQIWEPKELKDLDTYKNTIEKILKAGFRSMKKFGGTDIHAGNIGYFPQKPNTFFYFDM